MSTLVKVRLFLVAFSALAFTLPAPADEPADIYFDRTELPLDAAVLAERMEKFAAENRAEAEARIDAKRKEVVAALGKQAETEKAKGNAKGAAAIRRQIEVWEIEDKAREAGEKSWAGAKARQQGADWKALITDPISLAGWNKFGLPEAITCEEGVIRVKSLLPALCLHPVGSQSAVVRGKMKINLDRARLGQQQAGIGFQLGSGANAGGFTAIFQHPENQCVIHGGATKDVATVVAIEKTRLPTTDFVDIQIAMLKGIFIVFLDGRKIAEFASEIITNPPTVYIAAINGEAEFKDLALLSPTPAQIEGLRDGEPVK